MNYEERHLREELNSRINLVYSHSNEIMKFYISMLSAIIALSALVSNQSNFFMFLPLICFLVLISIVFAAQKYKENMKQIVDIATYILCFYTRPLTDHKNFGEFGSWEFSIFDVINKDKSGYESSKENKILFSMNKESFFLGVITFTIMFGLILITLITMASNINFLLFAYLVIAIFIAIIAILLLIDIYKYTNLKHFYEQKQKCIKKWLEYAIDAKFYTKKDINERFAGRLDYLIDK